MLRHIWKAVLFFALALASCANPYAQFYQGMPNARTSLYYASAHPALRVIETNDLKRSALGLLRKGYLPMGQSSFNAPSNKATLSDLKAQAKKIGADVVLLSEQYAGTVGGMMPLQEPQNTTSYSTGTASAYGPSGSVTVYGNETTNTYGSQTVMVPFAVSRSNVLAVFYVKVRWHIGIFPEPLDDATRQRLQTDAGIRVLAVVEGTPAFRADILPGDVVLALDGKAIESRQGYRQLLQKYAGDKVTLRIDRNGTIIKKTLRDRRIAASRPGS